MNNLEIINKLEKLRKEKKYIEILKYATKEGLNESKNFDSSTLELYNKITQEAYEIFSNNYVESNLLGLENGKIMEKLVNYIFDKKYKKIIDYHNKEGKEKSLNFDKEYFQMYNIYVGASYQELGEIEKANCFFDLYLDSLEISNKEVENINKELTKKNNKKTELNKNHIKMIYLVNELNKISLDYKVRKEDYNKYACDNNIIQKEVKKYNIYNNKGSMLLHIIELLLLILSIIFIFINWKIALVLFSIGLILHNFKKGPDFLLNFISGYLFLLGIIFIFINFNFGLILIVLGFFISLFRIKGNKINNEYYGIMNELNSKYGLIINPNEPWNFTEGNEGNYEIYLFGKHYNVKVEENGKFSW